MYKRWSLTLYTGQKKLRIIFLLELPHYLWNDASSCEMSVECRQLSKTSQMSFNKHYSQFCRHVETLCFWPCISIYFWILNFDHLFSPYFLPYVYNTVMLPVGPCISWVNDYTNEYWYRVKNNVSTELTVMFKTGFEPTPLIHCSTIRLALRPAP
jgi:uncharacterized protein involved in tolerance to divalent cations